MDKGVEQEGDEEGDDGRTDERTKRTEADVEPARTDEDSKRWKQAAAVITDDE